MLALPRDVPTRRRHMIRATVRGMLVGFLLLTACRQAKQAGERHQGARPRVAIAGLAIESSTFSPAKSREEDFHARTGDKVLDDYPFLAPGSNDRNRAVWFPTLT